MNTLRAPRFTIIESPFVAPTKQERERNVRYVRAAMRDCFLRGEIPFASHALYTLPGVLRDEDAHERSLGMEAGFALTQTLSGWARATEMTFAVTGEVWRGRVVVAIYEDLGVSSGMRTGIGLAEEMGLTVERRTLPAEVLGPLVGLAICDTCGKVFDFSNMPGSLIPTTCGGKPFCSGVVGWASGRDGAEP